MIPLDDRRPFKNMVCYLLSIWHKKSLFHVRKNRLFIPFYLYLFSSHSYRYKPVQEWQVKRAMLVQKRFF